MEPGVPFALLAGVQLLAAATALGLAAVSCTRRVWSSWAPLIVLGSLVLAVSETLTAVLFGAASSSGLLWARAVGFGLLAVGLWPAGRQAGPAAWPPRPPWRRAPSAGLPLPPSVAAGGSLAVVVPLGSGVPAAAAAALAGFGAAAVALDHLRDGSRRRRIPAALLATSLGLAAAACAVAPAAASSSGAAMVVLGLRALSALGLVAMFVVLSQYSVLGKVAGAIVAGVLTVGVAAVAVIGTVVESAFEDSQAEQARAVAEGRVHAILDDDRAQARRGAELVTRCPAGRLSCEQVLRPTDLGALDPVAAVLGRDGGFSQLQGSFLSRPAQEALRGHPLVQRVLDAPPGAATPPAAELVRLGQRGGEVALLGVAASEPDAERPGGGAAVWLVPLDDAMLQAAADLTGGYDLSLVVDGDVTASSLSQSGVDRLEETARAAGGLDEGRGAGRTIRALGTSPVVHLASLPGPDGEPIALLAVSREAAATLSAERSALTQLVLVCLGLTVLLGAAGVLVGRRLVKPVRRLTAAAARVSAGELQTRSGVGGYDEVGALARAFDTMTSSLAGLTGDLRRAAEEENRLRTNLEAVLGSMSDGVVASDAAGLVTRANPAALALLGVDGEDEVRGRPLAEVMPVRGVDLGAAAHGEGVVVRRDGATLPVAVAASPLAGGGGRVVVVRDQTREREVERMKTEFLSNVSHELRTPLTPIRGYADLLLRRPGLPPEQSVLYAAAILDSCLRLTKVVDLLVDVAALQAGRVVPELRSVSATELLEGRADDWRRSAPERAGDLRLQVEPDLPPLSVDPFWLGRALDELIDNALKHTPPGTPVTLAAEARPGSSVALVVRDAGPGIPSVDRARLLGSFEQADASATRTVGGLGLGLAFVRRLAEDFGLTLGIESERGWGTEVSLVVPAGLRPRLLDSHAGVA